MLVEQELSRGLAGRSRVHTRTPLCCVGYTNAILVSNVTEFQKMLVFLCMDGRTIQYPLIWQVRRRSILRQVFEKYSKRPCSERARATVRGRRAPTTERETLTRELQGAEKRNRQLPDEVGRPQAQLQLSTLEVDVRLQTSSNSDSDSDK